MISGLGTGGRDGDVADRPGWAGRLRVVAPQHRLLEGRQASGEIGGKIQGGVAIARLHHPPHRLAPVRRTAAGAPRKEIELQQLRVPRVVGKQPPIEAGRIGQRRQTGQPRHVHGEHVARLGAAKLDDLQKTHPQQRIQQQRQDENHKQRSPIAQLVAESRETGSGGHCAGSCGMGLVVPRNQLKEEFFEVPLMVPVAQVLQRPLGEDLPAVQDRQAVAELLRLAHDVRGENDALAVVAQLGHRSQQRRATNTSSPAVASSKISTGGSWTAKT